LEPLLQAEKLKARLIAAKSHLVYFLAAGFVYLSDPNFLTPSPSQRLYEPVALRAILRNTSSCRNGVGPSL
jgi:hypothetical protein